MSTSFVVEPALQTSGAESEANGHSQAPSHPSTEMFRGEMRTITEYRYNDMDELVEVVQSYRLEKPRIPRGCSQSQPTEGASNNGHLQAGVKATGPRKERDRGAYPQDVFTASEEGLQTYVKGKKPAYRGKKSNRRAGQRDDVSYGIRIRNLSPNTTHQDLEELAKPFGLVTKIYVARDNATGLCRGFGFVHFKKEADASNAIAKLHNFGFDHLLLKADWVKKKSENTAEELSYPPAR